MGIRSGEWKVMERTPYAPYDAVISTDEKNQLYFAANDFINKKYSIRQLNWKTGYEEEYLKVKSVYIRLM